MIWVDYLIIGIIALSAIIGLIRGLVREVVSLGVWIAAALIAWTYHPEAAELLAPWISTQSVRLATGFVILILVVLVLGALLGHVLAKLVEKTGLTGTDRLLGAVFGGARGAVLVAMLVFLAALTPLPEDPWWGESTLIGRFQVLAERMLELVPPDLFERLKQL